MAFARVSSARTAIGCRSICRVRSSACAGARLRMAAFSAATAMRASMDRLIAQPTTLRAHKAEFGITAPQGLQHVEILVTAIAHEDKRLPDLARSILQMIAEQLHDTTVRIREIEARLAKWHRQSPVSQLLATVPGIGIMGASAITAAVTDPSVFRSGREFAAWLGMTPRQNSSGGKERLGRTSKRGDKYIRCLLVAGAVSVLRHTRNRTTKDATCVRGLLARRPTKVAAIALANKTARIAWAVMARGEAYRSKDLIGQAA